MTVMTMIVAGNADRLWIGVKEMTNYERIKTMNMDELAAFLLKVNLAYSEDCMIEISECKHLQIDGGCKLCFKEWLESEAT